MNPMTVFIFFSFSIRIDDSLSIISFHSIRFILRSFALRFSSLDHQQIMGNRSSHRTDSNSSEKSSKRMHKPKNHNNKHQQTMNQVLNEHVSFLSTKIDPADHQRLAIDLHSNALNVAMRHHLNATTRQYQHLYPQTHQFVYSY